eukprot:TRINITY_DN67051_c7_g12_i1.p1 TRINITY_DN67051_c7_g12~~TRINITY_DN67051_c7_g12_i1.p1  ORF type:complete len:809 (-),score=175.56 TRINITY_DN67051_c7_g12_i1:1525-3804(-)
MTGKGQGSNSSIPTQPPNPEQRPASTVGPPPVVTPGGAPVDGQHPKKEEAEKRAELCNDLSLRAADLVRAVTPSEQEKEYLASAVKAQAPLPVSLKPEERHVGPQTDQHTVLAKHLTQELVVLQLQNKVYEHMEHQQVVEHHQMLTKHQKELSDLLAKQKRDEEEQRLNHKRQMETTFTKHEQQMQRFKEGVTQQQALLKLTVPDFPSTTSTSDENQDGMNVDPATSSTTTQPQTSQDRKPPSREPAQGAVGDTTNQAAGSTVVQEIKQEEPFAFDSSNWAPMKVDSETEDKGESSTTGLPPPPPQPPQPVAPQPTSQTDSTTAPPMPIPPQPTSIPTPTIPDTAGTADASTTADQKDGPTSVKLEKPNDDENNGPMSVDSLADQVSALQQKIQFYKAKSEDYRTALENKAVQHVCLEGKELDFFGLEIEKLKQQYHQKMLLKAGLQSERQNQMYSIIQLRKTADATRRKQVTDQDKKHYHEFQKTLSNQIEQRRKLLLDVKQEIHRVAKAQRYQRNARRRHFHVPADDNDGNEGTAIEKGPYSGESSSDEVSDIDTDEMDAVSSILYGDQASPTHSNRSNPPSNNLNTSSTNNNTPNQNSQDATGGRSSPTGSQRSQPGNGNQQQGTSPADETTNNPTPNTAQEGETEEMKVDAEADPTDSKAKSSGSVAFDGVAAPAANKEEEEFEEDEPELEGGLEDEPEGDEDVEDDDECDDDEEEEDEDESEEEFDPIQVMMVAFAECFLQCITNEEGDDVEKD